MSTDSMEIALVCLLVMICCECVEAFTGRPSSVLVLIKVSAILVMAVVLVDELMVGGMV